MTWRDHRGARQLYRQLWLGRLGERELWWERAWEWTVASMENSEVQRIRVL